MVSFLFLGSFITKSICFDWPGDFSLIAQDVSDIPVISVIRKCCNEAFNFLCSLQDETDEVQTVNVQRKN